MTRTWLGMAAAGVGISACLVFGAAMLPDEHPATAAPAASARPGALEGGPSMSARRAAHTATSLPDGRVLVAGGFTREGAAAGAEIYDPRTQKFSPLPNMVANRHSHTATLLADGKVLLAGGYGANDAILTTGELFDPATNSFTSTGSLRDARANHAAVLLRDGRVLFVGGAGRNWTTLSGTEIYDPTTGRFSRSDAMSVAREGHVAVRLHDGRVLVAGGHRGRRERMTVDASAEVYDPGSGAFTRVSDMGVRRHKHDGIVLRDGRVLITGGSDERDNVRIYDSTELFDPRTGTFAAGPRMNLGRYKHLGTSVLLPTGDVLVAGGAARAEMYDPNSRTFSIVPGESAMPGRFPAVALLPNGAALIAGGYGSDIGTSASTWLYRP